MASYAARAGVPRRCRQFKPLKPRSSQPRREPREGVNTAKDAEPDMKYQDRKSHYQKYLNEMNIDGSLEAEGTSRVLYETGSAAFGNRQYVKEYWQDE